VRAGGTKEDIITHHQYDRYGRIDNAYLPYGLSNNNGSFDINSDTHAQEYHFDTHTDVGNRDTWYTYQNSPLNEVKKERLPMDASLRTSNHQGEIEYEYGFNNNQDSIYTYSVDYNDEGDIIRYGSYLRKHPTYMHPDKRFFKKTTKDENWEPSLGKNHTVEEYTDPKGNMILKRTYNNNQKHDTYYVHDYHNNLCYVIPPLAADKETLSQNDIDDLCYQYLYDTKQRMRMKKIPGKDWEYTVYDVLDRPVLTQDANLRKNNQWLFTKYDAFDRVAYTGIYTHPLELDQVAMQTEVDRHTVLHENFIENSSWTHAGTKIQYSNHVFPNVNLDILTINYYDDYHVEEASEINGTSYPLIQNQITNNSVKGLSTYTKVKVLNTSDWVFTKLTYDHKGRIIANTSFNTYLNTLDIVENQLDFTGKPVKTRTLHQKDGQTPIVTIDDYTYDHIGRLATHHQRIGDHNIPLQEVSQDIITVTDTPENNATLIANTITNIME